MSTKATEQATERLALPAREVAKLLNISQRHVWKLTASGRLPQPIRLGRSVRWLYRDILAQLETLRGDSSGGAP